MLEVRKFQMPDPKTGVVTLEVVNSVKQFKWRIKVKGTWSRWSSHYPGILTHRGVCYATAYWAGVLPHEQPFMVVALSEVKS